MERRSVSRHGVEVSLSPDPDEQSLIGRAGRGDLAAFRTLVDLHQRRIYAVALGMVHDADDAEDVVQETFVKAFHGLRSFDGKSLFSTWTHRIAMNAAIDLLRKRRKERVDFDDTIEARAVDDDSGISPARGGADPARALADKQTRGAIRGALAKLSPAHRAVLMMREVEGLSYQEMAERIDCSIGTIMSRLFHARKKMQDHLIEAEVTP